MAAIDDVLLQERRNFMHAINTNTGRDIRLSYEVSGLADPRPVPRTRRIAAGSFESLGPVDAGGGQILSYRKTGAIYLTPIKGKKKPSKKKAASKKPTRAAKKVAKTKLAARKVAKKRAAKKK